MAKHELCGECGEIMTEKSRQESDFKEIYHFNCDNCGESWTLTVAYETMEKVLVVGRKKVKNEPKGKEKKTQILDEAKRIVTEREAANGPPTDTFYTITGFWNSYLGDALTEELTPVDVAQLMLLLKVARQRHGDQNKDHFTDEAGYAENSAMLASEARDEN